VTRAVIHVAIALVWRDGRLLVTRRLTNVHLAGLWEFPGGKLLPNESPPACAEREVWEETAVKCRATRVREPIAHDYEERSVRLYPVDCDWLSGSGQPLQVAELEWLLPNELSERAFPAANAPLIATLAQG
jgi:mutator protein MutT